MKGAFICTQHNTAIISIFNGSANPIVICLRFLTFVLLVAYRHILLAGLGSGNAENYEMSTRGGKITKFQSTKRYLMY
jgi:hypothetical protein